MFFVNDKTGKHSRTPLMSAASRKQHSVVELLLKSTGIDVNAQDSDGMTALMHAAQIGDLEVIATNNIDHRKLQEYTACNHV